MATDRQTILSLIPESLWEQLFIEVLAEIKKREKEKKQTPCSKEEIAAILKRL